MNKIMRRTEGERIISSSASISDMAREDAPLGTLIILSAGGFAVAPANPPADKIINVPKGASSRAISEMLADEEIIRSPSVLRMILFISGNESNILAGDYLISGPENIFKIAY